MRMLLVAREGRARECFVAALETLGAACDVAATSKELLAAMRHCQYNGVLFDVPTIIRCKDFDKKLLHSVAEVYPSVRLKHDPTSDAIFALGAAAGAGTKDGLSVFVAACRDFLPRGLRRGERVEAHLPAILWRMPPGADAGNAAGEKTCTINISFLGCFLFTTTAWTIGETSHVTFPGVTSRPVRARVAWYEPWGRRRAVPGVGLAFLEMPRELRSELARLGCDCGDFEVASAAKEP